MSETLRHRLLDVVMALPELPVSHGTVGVCGDRLLKAVEDYLLSDEVVRRSLEMGPPGLMLGCTCREASYGPRPDHCRCDDRAHAYAMKERRAVLAAALGQERADA